MHLGDCNLCLAVNRRTTNIMNTHLQVLYEKLANYKVSPEQCLWMCFVCHTRLQQCHQLSLLAEQTSCYLTSTILQEDIKEKQHSAGLVKLSRSTTYHFNVPSSTTNKIVEALVKNEPLGALEEFAFDNEDLEQYNDVGNSEDWYSNDKKYCNKETFSGQQSYEHDIQDVAPFKNEIEIEIKPHNNTNEVNKKFKEENIKDEIKMEDKDSNYTTSAAVLGTIYTCNICRHNFSTLSLLQNHKKTHHNTSKLNYKSYTSGKVVCPICGKYYADKNVLARHKKIHSEVRPFSCGNCSKTFTRKDHYNKHLRTYNGRCNPCLHSCDICYEKFLDSTQLKKHQCSLNTQDGTYSCDICNNSFDHLALFNLHKTNVHGIAQFPEVTIKKISKSKHSVEHGHSEVTLGNCKKRIFLKTSVDRSNIKKKKHMCDRCSNCFKTRHSLEVHITLEHRGMKYICDHCDKAFLRRAGLVLHLRTHTGDKRYCCDACGKTFTYRSSLNTHRRVHLGLKPYSCDLCGKKFTAFGQLAEHKLVHSAVRAFSCHLCNKSFKRARHLKKHVTIHTGEKPYTCDVCFKTFSRNDNFTIHKRIHTGEKPFRCDVCDMSFSENRHLKKHKSTHESDMLVS